MEREYGCFREHLEDSNPISSLPYQSWNPAACHVLEQLLFIQVLKEVLLYTQWITEESELQSLNNSSFVPALG